MTHDQQIELAWAAMPIVVILLLIPVIWWDKKTSKQRWDILLMPKMMVIKVVLVSALVSVPLHIFGFNPFS